MEKINRGFAPILILLIVLALGALGYFSYKNLNTKSLTSTNQPTFTNTPSSDPTINWKTYADPKYSFKYPSDWIIHSLPQNSYQVINVGDKDNSVVVSLTEKLPGMGLEDKVLIKEEKMLLGGHNVTKTTYDNTSTGKYECWISLTQKSGDFLIVEYKSEENLKTLDQILSTFKFTDLNTSNFQLRNFSTNDKFMNGQSYPQELLNLKDTDLVGFECGNKFGSDYNGNYSYIGSDNKTEQLTDSQILRFLANKEKEARATSDRSAILTVTICNMENNYRLIIYEITPGGGGAGSNVYYGYISINGNFGPTSIIPIESGAYFGCGKVLAITKDNYVYAVCGSGDGGAGSESIYKVNLNKPTNAELLYKCSSTSNDADYQNPIIKCGTTQ